MLSMEIDCTPYYVVSKHLKYVDGTRPYLYQRESLDCLGLCSSATAHGLLLVPCTWAQQGNLPFTKLPVVSQARLKSANTAAA